MLDRSAPAIMTDELWETLPIRTELPTCELDPTSETRCFGPAEGTRRSHRRASAKSRVLLLASSKCYASYLRDVSAAGLGLLAPIQLFPKQCVQLWLPELEPLEMIVRRCRKLGPNCFLCGGLFTRGALSPGQLRRIIGQAELGRH